MTLPPIRRRQARLVHPPTLQIAVPFGAGVLGRRHVGPVRHERDAPARVALVILPVGKARGIRRVRRAGVHAGAEARSEKGEKVARVEVHVAVLAEPEFAEVCEVKG